MNSYVTGNIIKRLREERKLTQAELAEILNVSDKAISKWETGKGYPDITLIEPIAAALNVSVMELLSGDEITNRNRSFNMKRTLFYVCPVCGNVIAGTGEAVVCCHGIALPPAEAEEAEGEHEITVSIAEDEYFAELSHPMTKEHHISFLAAVTDDGIQIKKLYPEGNAEARFKINRTYAIYAYCNRHGLFRVRISKSKLK
ncbi:MAG: helix-turn-helix domain-containing protein [Clostridia bacterium]|nr:helix-turn-helix domain-containing protein [Clostridia bacterium]